MRIHENLTQIAAVLLSTDEDARPLRESIQRKINAAAAEIEDAAFVATVQSSLAKPISGLLPTPGLAKRETEYRHGGRRY
jgi:hypothetical protein